MTEPARTRAAICAAVRSRQADCRRHLARAAFALQFLATARGPSTSVPFHTRTLASARPPPPPLMALRLQLVAPPPSPTLPPLPLSRPASLSPLSPSLPQSPLPQPLSPPLLLPLLVPRPLPSLPPQLFTPHASLSLPL